MQEVTAGWEGSLGKLASDKLCLTDALPVPVSACEIQMDSQTPSKGLLPSSCSPDMFLQWALLCAQLFFSPRSFIPCFFRKNAFHFCTLLPCERSYHIVASVTSYCFFFPWSIVAGTNFFGILETCISIIYLKDLPVLLDSLFLQASSLKLPSNSDFTQDFCL